MGVTYKGNDRDVDNSVTFDPSLEYGATFRFPVTWNYLTVAEAPPNQPTPQLNPQTAVVSTPVPVAAPTRVKAEVVQAEVKAEPPAAPPPALKTVPLRATGPEAKWEMVIPKMARPTAPSGPARRLRALQQAAEPAAQPLAQEAAEAAEIPTEISFYVGSEASFVPRRWKLLGLSAAVVVVGAVVAWIRPGSDAGSGTQSTPTAAGTWSRRTAYVVGAKAPREILVYSDSQDVKNYRIEFAWVPDPRGVGWIFRATDSANYYAAKLRLLEAGATPTLSAEHFVVVKGVEGAHSRKVITLGRTKSQVLVRMDATGPAFTLYLQGSPADYWTDERFDIGSLGFYEEGGQRPVLQALRFTLFKKSGLQTVMTSLQ